MKIFDMHIHTALHNGSRTDLIEQLDKAGIYGGCVFSAPPPQFDAGKNITFDERLNDVLKWKEGHENRIFTALWIHPYEENILEKIHLAVDRGIDAFKMICCDFYVYEEGCIKVLEEIAKLGKPVIFHSGILWDGQVSSSYNRPLNWEALLRIKGLRFSMGHCSWPWIDECIAMYGKFLNALQNGDTAEMFFDITPGTPEIYREELLTKLYTIGYDVGNNIMFGTDASAENYSSKWASGWLKTDNDILNRLGVSLHNKENLYYNNFMRFLGKTDEKIVHASPETDDSHLWSPVNAETTNIIKKWYDLTGISKEWDADFEKALSEIKISDSINIETYTSNGDGKRDFLSFMYMCENLKNKYQEKNIPEEILIDTVKDLAIWTDIWSDIKNGLFLGECGWLTRHLSMKLFKLGRLQFCMAKSEADIPDIGVAKGDDIIEVHIQASGPLKETECKESIAMAREFFGKYFPEYNYKCFTCHSWLLDDSLDELLSETSNIVKFRRMFELVTKEESNAILRYVFSWDTNLRNLINKNPVSSFAEIVKKRALGGGKFYETLGFIEK